MKMGYGKAIAIFMQIDSDEYSDEEKALAIHRVLHMPTHNGITKDVMLKVISWLFEEKWTVEAKDGEGEKSQ